MSEFLQLGLLYTFTCSGLTAVSAIQDAGEWVFTFSSMIKHLAAMLGSHSVWYLGNSLVIVRPA